MAKRKGDLSDRLLQWATEEMGFRNNKRPPVTADNLKEICRGNMASIWEYVTEHVHPKEMVHKVKGNIRLHQLQQGSSSKVNYQKGSKQSEGRENLVKRRKELQGKLKSAKRDVDHLEKDIRRMKDDISQTDAEYNESMVTIQQLNHKRALLQAYLNQCKVTMATYNEFQSSLQEKHQHYAGLASKSGKSGQGMLFFSKERVDSTGAQEDVLETACTKQVREACSQIQVNFLDVLQNKTTDQEAIRENKARLWDRIEETMKAYSADDIVKSLTIITNEAAAYLTQKTSQIDVEQDIKDLKFRYESGQGFVDLSLGKGELKSVQQLITEKQLAHIQRFMEGERNRTQAAKMNRELHHLVARMEQKLAEKYAGQPGELELAKTLFRAELNLVSASAALKVLKLQQEEQEALAAASKREKELLFTKYKQIQDFQKVTDRKQSLIQVLIKENLNSRKQLDDTRKKIQHYTQRSVCEHESGTVAMTTSLKDSAANEIQAFNGLSLDMLELTKLPSGELKSTNQLSICRFKSISPALGGDALWKMRIALHFPLYQAPEKLMAHVIKIKCAVSDVEGLLRVRELLQASISASRTKDTDIIQHIKGLCERVTASDVKHTEQLCPVLQSRMTEGAETINITQQTKSDLTAWWDQPAQHVTPWVKVDDLSYPQWLDRWIMAVSQLKESIEAAQN